MEIRKVICLPFKLICLPFVKIGGLLSSVRNHWLVEPWVEVLGYRRTVINLASGLGITLLVMLTLLITRLLLTSLIIPIYESSRIRYGYLKRTPPAEHQLYLPTDLKETIDSKLQAFKEGIKNKTDTVKPVSFSLLCHGAPGNGKSETMRYIARSLEPHTNIYCYRAGEVSYVSRILGFHSQSTRLINLIAYINKNGGVLILDEFDTTLAEMTSKGMIDALVKPSQSTLLSALLVPIDAADSVMKHRVLITCSNNLQNLNERLTRVGRLGDTLVEFFGIDSRNPDQISTLHGKLAQEWTQKTQEAQNQTVSWWTRKISPPNYRIVPLEEYVGRIRNTVGRREREIIETQLRTQKLTQQSTINVGTGSEVNLAEHVISINKAAERLRLEEKQRFEGNINPPYVIPVCQAIELAKDYYVPSS